MPQEKSRRKSDSEAPTGKAMPALDLSVIDKAYGNFADLYSDVLRVNVGATQEQIQVAYFDRRSELFTLLAKIDAKPQDDKTAKDRYMAERKMDSVVLAVRILGEDKTRHQYDLIRQERLLKRRRAQNGESAETGKQTASSPAANSSTKKKKPSSTPRKARSGRYSSAEEDTLNQTLETDYSTEDDGDTETAGDTNTFFSDSRFDDTTTFGTGTVGDETMETYSVVSADVNTKTGLFCLDSSRVFRNVVDEIQGACEDTLTSMDQVFNAFTLTDKDIKAVTKRIDKAKKQLDT